MKKLLFSILSLGTLAANAQVIPVGTSGNMLTLLNANTHCISVSDACSSVVVIHRSDPAVNAGDNVAHYRYAISSDFGNTFLLNQGKLNASADNSAKSSRYPQVIIDNASNATNPANVYMQYSGTYHNGGDWDGLNSGTAKMDNSLASFTDNFTQMNSGNIAVATSLCKGAANTYWQASYSLDAANEHLGDILVMKGTQTGNSVAWTVDKVLTPAWDLHKDGKVKSGTINIDFDPSGQKGWISFLGDIRNDTDPNKDEVYDINFYRTIDGGANWSGPYAVNLNDFALIQSVYPTPTTGANIIHAVSTTFESDLAVDADGQPHVFFGMGYGSSEADITAGNGYSIRASNFFSMHYNVNIDKFVLNFVDDIKQLRADSIGLTLDANNATVANSEDNRLQVVKTPAGDGIYFIYSDNIMQTIGGIDTVIENNTARYLYVTGYAPTSGGISIPRVVSQEAAYSAVNDKAYFTCASPIVQRNANGSVLPIVYGVLNVDQKIESASGISYMQNVEIRDDSIAYLSQKDTLGFDVPETWPVGVENTVKNEGGLTIYPNPATSHFSVANVAGKNNTIKVYSMNGSVLINETFAPVLFKAISIKDLAVGTYVVELVSDGKVQKTKLIKK